MTRQGLSGDGAPMPAVAVVLVNYRQPGLTEDAVESLRRCGDFDGMEVLVVDNGSADGSLERLRAACPDATVLDAGANLGFAAGSNVGVRHALEAGARWILLLNNDTEVEPGFLSRLLSAAEDGRTLAAPKIVHADTPSRIWYGGGHVGRFRGGFYHETDPELAGRARDVTFASGCCLLLPAAFFRACGLMDESYFLYYEDAELCVRARKAGWRIRYEPGSVVRHRISASTGGADSKLSVYYGTRNRLALLTRHGFPWVAKAFVVATRVLKLVLVPVRPGLRFAAVGIVDWLRGRMGERKGL